MHRVRFGCVHRVRFGCVHRVRFGCEHRVRFGCEHRVRFGCEHHDRFGFDRRGGRRNDRRTLVQIGEQAGSRQVHGLGTSGRRGRIALRLLGCRRDLGGHDAQRTTVTRLEQSRDGFATIVECPATRRAEQSTVTSAHHTTHVGGGVGRITVGRPGVEPHGSRSVRAGSVRPVSVHDRTRCTTSGSFTGPPHRGQITPRRGVGGAIPRGGHARIRTSAGAEQQVLDVQGGFPRLDQLLGGCGEQLTVVFPDDRDPVAETFDP